MAIVGDVGTVSKFVEAIKDLPSWLLTALAVAANVLLFVPFVAAGLSAEFRPWVIVASVVFTLLALFKWISIGTGAVHTSMASRKARKTFHLTPIAQHCRWSVAKQGDDSMVTQITADFLVKNQTAAPIGLVGVRLLKPTIKGEVVHDSILVREPHGNMYGTAYASDHRIPPGAALPAHLLLRIRGVPRVDQQNPLVVVLGVADEDGHEQRVRVSCKGIPAPTNPAAPAALEPLYSITNRVVKEVVSVLQSELSRYDKCGRQVGGLGSVHIVYRGTAMTGMGSEMWIANSTANQEIAPDPEAAELRSDNLAALVGYYARLSADDDRRRFIAALLDRLDPGMGYLRVSYLIVCVLWKVGMLTEALDQAKARLPQGETKEFGLSNVLMMLNGLLRYRHPDFTPEMLDHIERFMHGMQEHPFQAPQKIAAIRARRLATRE